MPAPGWIRHKDFDEGGYSDIRSHALNEAELRFFAGRDRVTTIAESSDPNADYSYDDYALCELDGEYFVFNTSGCSCPSPSETWDLVHNGDRESTLNFLQPGGGESFAEFLREVEVAGWTLLTPAPAPSARRDW